MKTLKITERGWLKIKIMLKTFIDNVFSDRLATVAVIFLPSQNSESSFLDSGVNTRELSIMLRIYFFSGSTDMK